MTALYKLNHIKATLLLTLTVTNSKRRQKQNIRVAGGWGAGNENFCAVNRIV